MLWLETLTEAKVSWYFSALFQVAEGISGSGHIELEAGSAYKKQIVIVLF